jgi:hypothetical protein
MLLIVHVVQTRDGGERSRQQETYDQDNKAEPMKDAAFLRRWNRLRRLANVESLLAGGLCPCTDRSPTKSLCVLLPLITGYKNTLRPFGEEHHRTMALFLLLMQAHRFQNRSLAGQTPNKAQFGTRRANTPIAVIGVQELGYFLENSGR